MGHFFSELHRRRVPRAALLYVLGGLGTVEAAELVFPRLQLLNGRVTEAEPVVHAIAHKHSDSLFAVLCTALFHWVKGEATSARLAREHDPNRKRRLPVLVPI